MRPVIADQLRAHGLLEAGHEPRSGAGGWWTTWPYTARQEVTMDLLAMTLLGFTFSGTLALGVVIVVVVALGLMWFARTRQRRR